MGSVTDVRAVLLGDWQVAIERTGMLAVSADAAWALAHATCRALAAIDGVDADALRSTLGRIDFGAESSMTMRRWFTDQAGRAQGNAEVVAWESQVLAAFGWLPVPRLDDEAWSKLRLADPTHYADGAWTRGRLRRELPAPSLIVDRRIHCYAPDDPRASWAFFDLVYEFGYANRDDDALPLRSVRAPGRGYMNERTVVTPEGREFVGRPRGDLDAHLSWLV